MHRARALLHASTSLLHGGAARRTCLQQLPRERGASSPCCASASSIAICLTPRPQEAASAPPWRIPPTAPPPRSSTTPALPPPPPLLHAVGANATAATVAAPPVFAPGIFRRPSHRHRLSYGTFGSSFAGRAMIVQHAPVRRLRGQWDAVRVVEDMCPRPASQAVRTACTKSGIR